MDKWINEAAVPTGVMLQEHRVQPSGLSLSVCSLKLVLNAPNTMLTQNNLNMAA